MIDLSICMIVKDEYENLSRLLPWLSLCGAEVIVVDTGSTDGTTELIHQHIGTHHYFKWCDDFAQARNFSLSLACRSNILWLDADDRVDDFSWQRIISLAQSNSKAFRFIIKNPLEQNFQGKTISEEIFRQVRLFPREISQGQPTFNGVIHEEVRSSLEQLKIPIEEAQVEILHMGYVDSELRAKKSQRNLDILNHAVKNEVFNPFLEMEYANALFQTSSYEEALESYAKIWQSPLSDATEVKLFTPVFIANTLKELGQKEDALDWYCKSSEESPQVLSAHYEAARSYFESGQFVEAEKFLNRIIDQEIEILSIPQNSIGIKRNAFGLLCLGFFAQRKYTELWDVIIKLYNNKDVTHVEEFKLRDVPIDLWVFIECGIELKKKNITREILNYLCLKALNPSHDQILQNLDALDGDVKNKSVQSQLAKDKMENSKNKTKELSPAEVDKLLGTIKKPLKPRGLPNTLSICMIVKNEENNIEAAVNSFLRFADEIIVNDTGSSDRTIEILRTLPVKIIQTEWKDDFSYSRNASIAEATCSWILWMDADDRVPEDQVESFNKLKTAPLDRCFGFQIVNTQGGLPIGTRFMQTRMFPNHPSLLFERTIHEQIIFSCAKLGLHSMFTETLIWHTGYEDPKIKAEKAQRNLDLLEGEAEGTSDPILLMQVGDSLAILEKWSDASLAYIRAYEIPDCKTINKDVWKELPNSIGRCMQQAGQLEEALTWFVKGQANGPEKVEPWFFQGETYIKLGKWDQARGFFEKSISLERSFSGVSNQYDVMQIYSLKYLCDIELRVKNWEIALQRADQFLRKYPEVVESRVFKAKACMGLSQFEEAEKSFKSAIEMNATASLEAWQGLLSCLDMQGKDAEFIQVKENMQKHFPTQASQIQLGSSRTPLMTATHSQPDLSVCIIVKNESANIGDCLKSIEPLGAEIIVVDTGSEDNTVEIAKSFGAHMYFFDWVQDFGAARNVSLKHATGRWILWMDADDRLPDSEVSRILSLVKAQAQTAYGFLIKNSQDNGKTGSVFNQIRLFPNSSNLRFEGKVHEQISPSLSRAGIAIEFLNLKVIHTGYLDEQTSIEKQKRNLKILMDELEDNPKVKTPVRYFSIAGAYFDFKDFKNAIKWYGLTIELAQSTGQDPHVKSHCPVKIAECQANLGNYELSLDLISKIQADNPTNPEALLLQAQMQERLGQRDLAMISYSQLFVFQETQSMLPVDYQRLHLNATKFIAEELKNQSKMEIALEILKLGLSIGNGDKVSSQKVLSLYFDFEEYDLCLAILEQEKFINKDADHFLNLGKIHILLNQVEQAQKALKEGIRLFPQDQDILQLFQALKADLGA